MSRSRAVSSVGNIRNGAIWRVSTMADLVNARSLGLANGHNSLVMPETMLIMLTKTISKPSVRQPRKHLGKPSKGILSRYHQGTPKTDNSGYAFPYTIGKINKAASIWSRLHLIEVTYE